MAILTKALKFNQQKCGRISNTPQQRCRVSFTQLCQNIGEKQSEKISGPPLGGMAQRVLFTEYTLSIHSITRRKAPASFCWLSPYGVSPLRSAAIFRNLATVSRKLRQKTATLRISSDKSSPTSPCSETLLPASAVSRLSYMCCSLYPLTFNHSFGQSLLNLLP